MGLVDNKDILIGMLYDTVHDKWHPIFFKAHGFCSGDLENAKRYKSGGHHTEGFATRDEAVVSIDETVVQLLESDCTVKNAWRKAFSWDGEGIPAIQCLFYEDSDHEGEWKPL